MAAAEGNAGGRKGQGIKRQLQDWTPFNLHPCVVSRPFCATLPKMLPSFSQVGKAERCIMPSMTDLLARTNASTSSIALNG